LPSGKKGLCHSEETMNGPWCKLSFAFLDIGGVFPGHEFKFKSPFEKETRLHPSLKGT